MSEETTVRGEYAEGVSAVVDGVGFVVETLGGEEDVQAVTSGKVVGWVEVDDLVCYEDVA